VIFGHDEIQPLLDGLLDKRAICAAVAARREKVREAAQRRV
jgi:hypothetical protein